MLDVTLISIDSVYVEKTIRALRKCMNQMVFANVLLLTHEEWCLPDGITLVPIPQIKTLEDYSEFMLRELPSYRHLFAGHCLCVQHDGYIIRPGAWEDGFLEYDYIGAPWPNGCVGNGGFSLRSKRFFDALAEIRESINNPHPEDWRICHEHREDLEIRGVKFAPSNVAHRFSVENVPYVDSFGFHGLYTMATLGDKE